MVRIIIKVYSVFLFIDAKMSKLKHLHSFMLESIKHHIRFLLIFFFLGLEGFFSAVVHKIDGISAFWEGSSAMKRSVWAQPAYFPYLQTNASDTRPYNLGVKRVPASSGMRYVVAIFLKPAWRKIEYKRQIYYMDTGIQLHNFLCVLRIVCQPIIWQYALYLP